MIKSNELKIRNLLKVNDLIVSISKIEYERFWGSFKDKLFFQSEEMQPIELNEEWLIKFGFKKTWFGYENISTGIEIEPLENEDYTICINANEYHIGENFKYVHQLQNIYFALTNKELELIKE